MKNISEYIQCANCGACYNLCPVEAIRVDEEGLFYQVKVSENKCINCGKCAEICPVNKPEPRQRVLSVYYGTNLSEKTLKGSSSGGAFSAIADWILEENGLVYAACYSENRKSVVFQSTDQATMDELRRSKYVESLVGFCFREIKTQLDTGRKVLFCGTPCETAGLIRYLGKQYTNLYSCDFKCGGLASHKIYQCYLQELEQRYGAEVIQVNFRPKTLGWESYAVKVTFSNGRVYHKPAELDPYYAAFLKKHYSVRDCCLSCPFEDNHYADVTLADFWNYRSTIGTKRNTKGLSLVIVNSKKGQEMVEAASKWFQGRELLQENAVCHMGQKRYLREFMDRRQLFLECFQKEGLKSAAKYLSIPTGLAYLNAEMKAAMKRVVWEVK